MMEQARENPALTPNTSIRRMMEGAKRATGLVTRMHRRIKTLLKEMARTTTVQARDAMCSFLSSLVPIREVALRWFGICARFWSAGSDDGSRKEEESEPGYDDGMFYIFMISMISMCDAARARTPNSERNRTEAATSAWAQVYRLPVDAILTVHRYALPATGSKLYSWFTATSVTKNIEVDKFAARRLQEKKSAHRTLKSIP
jgi:hypothetical protein